MSGTLKEAHPMLMVPYVFTFGVVIYTNGNAPVWPADALREAIVGALPPGTGVGQVTCTSHGICEVP
jgi:hypothetical protein